LTAKRITNPDNKMCRIANPTLRTTTGTSCATGFWRAAIAFCQLGIRLLTVKILVKYCLGIPSVSTLELFPTDMAFVHLDTVLGSVFPYNCAPTENAFFLFITFERRNALIVICTTAISAYFLSINPVYNNIQCLCRCCIYNILKHYNIHQLAFGIHLVFQSDYLY